MTQDVVYTIIISILTFVFAILTLLSVFKVKNYKFGDEKTFLEKLLLFFKKPFVTIVSLLIVASLTTILTIKKEADKNDLANVELDRRDLVRKKENLKITQIIIDTLRNANLMIGKLNKKIVSLEISQNKPIPDPIIEFLVVKDSISSGRLFFSIQIKANLADAKNVNIDMDFGYNLNDKYYVTERNSPISRDLLLLKDNPPTTTDRSIKNSNFEYLIFNFKGQYHNKKGKKFLIDNILIYELRNNRSGLPTPKILDEIKKQFKK